MEFDAEGNLLRHWGGPGAGYEWVKNEHGITSIRTAMSRSAATMTAAQRFIFTADGANGQVSTLLRDSGELIGQFGRHGRQPEQFKWVHNIAIDSKGNIYTAEVGFGRRVYKFERVN